jgi:hypothetical protein
MGGYVTDNSMPQATTLDQKYLPLFNAEMARLSDERSIFLRRKHLEAIVRSFTAGHLNPDDCPSFATQAHLYLSETLINLQLMLGLPQEDSKKLTIEARRCFEYAVSTSGNPDISPRLRQRIEVEEHLLTIGSAEPPREPELVSA